MSTLSFSLAAGAFIAAAAAYLGSVMLSRRMALVAGPLGHLTLPGIALALLWGLDVSLGAFPFVLLGVVLIWWIEARTRLPMEALTALVFAAGVAIAFLLLPIEQAETALVGDIMQTGAGDAALSVAVSLMVVLVVRHTYRKLVLTTISEELSAAEGIDVKRYNLMYLLLIAVVVALGVKVVGGLLTAALVAVPPAAARNVAHNLRQYAHGAMAIGVMSALAGVLLSHLTDLPAGPLIVLVSITFFVISFPFTR